MKKRKICRESGGAGDQAQKQESSSYSGIFGMYGKGDDAWGEGEGVVEKQLKENQRIFNYFILNQNESQIT